MTTIQKLDKSFKGLGLNSPKIKTIDKIETQGSLFLVDPTHPYLPWGNGVIPAINVRSVPNVLAERLSTLPGINGELNSYFKGTSTTTGGIKVERTGKGGLHAYIKQDASITDEAYGIYAPDAARNYINSNKDHKYYFSLWQRTTRSSTYANVTYNPQFLSYANSTAAGNFLTAYRAFSGIYGTYSDRNYNGEPNEETQHILAVATPPNAYSVDLIDYKALPWMVGNLGPWNNSGSLNSSQKLPSQIIYRAYAEDLTVSGRSYDEVYAIDFALYTKEVLTPGGRYYNDTFSNPYTM